MDLVSRFSLHSDLHQSEAQSHVLGDLGWITVGKKDEHVFVRPLGPLSVAKTQRPKAIDIEYLNSLRKQYHTLTLYVEPGLKAKIPERTGFSVEPFAHSKTSLVDLLPTEAKILTSFNQNTRRNIVHAEGVKLRSIPLAKLKPSALEDFFALYHSWTKLKSVVGYPEPFVRSVLKHHKDSGYIHLAYLGKVAVATLLTLSYDHVTTYYAAFAAPDGYKCAAPTLLTWTAIQTAKGSGDDIFDFGGIYDPRYPKMYERWQGFTKFKEGFRPTVITYPPTYLKLFW